MKILAPDGYYADGTIRPWREVKIITKVNYSTVLVEYLDSGVQDYCLERHLKRVSK